MHEIICPHWRKAFKIDEAGYADIAKQVRDGEFEQQLHERLELAEQDKQSAVELAQTKVASDMQKVAVIKDSEIQELKARLDAGEVTRKLAVALMSYPFQAGSARLCITVAIQRWARRRRRRFLNHPCQNEPATFFQGALQGG